MDTLFREYSREAWQSFHTDLTEFQPIEHLDRLVSLNDRLSQQDVKEIYFPLLDYIELTIKARKDYAHERDKFFAVEDPQYLTAKNPFIIGISGSVAVGKSTVARLLQRLLQESNPMKSVELITTDGFLYPNQELKRRQIMHRKGFPESYDMPALLDFMSRVKTGEHHVSYPLYSHDSYDIIPDEQGVMEAPDILIVEGINAFQLPENQQIYMNEYFDLSVYIDADPMDIKQWFTERYVMHIEMAKDDPASYYYPMTQWSDERIKDYGNQVWYTINLTNLVQHIAPTRNRADVILHKSSDHSIDRVSIRKY